MGTEFLAVNKDTNEAYDLGKGFWHEIIDENQLIHTENHDALLRKVKAVVSRFGMSDIEKHDYAVEITNDLISVGNILVLKRDSSDNDYFTYKVIGTRYK